MLQNPKVTVSTVSELLTENQQRRPSKTPCPPPRLVLKYFQCWKSFVMFVIKIENIKTLNIKYF